MIEQGSANWNYPPGVTDEDIDRAWGEEQEFFSDDVTEHEIDKAMELEGLRKLAEYEAKDYPSLEDYD